MQPEHVGLCQGVVIAGDLREGKVVNKVTRVNLFPPVDEAGRKGKQANDTPGGNVLRAQGLEA